MKPVMKPMSSEEQEVSDCVVSQPVVLRIDEVEETGFGTFFRLYDRALSQIRLGQVLGCELKLLCGPS